MHEVLQLSSNRTAKHIREIRELQHDYARYLIGTIQTWAMIMETYPNAIPSVIKHMKEMATSIQEITGVTLEDEP